jgi:GcrA cell cycle regulator
MDHTSTIKLLSYIPPQLLDCRLVRTDEQRREIIQLFSEGNTMASIANKMGCTRGAVAGVIYRYRQKGSQLRAPKIAPVSEPIKRIRLRLIEDNTEVTMKQLQPHMCKYPIGDPKLSDFRFCGCQRIADSPYCEKHTIICTDPRYRRHRLP